MLSIRANRWSEQRRIVANLDAGQTEPDALYGKHLITRNGRSALFYFSRAFLPLAMRDPHR